MSGEKKLIYFSLSFFVLVFSVSFFFNALLFFYASFYSLQGYCTTELTRSTPDLSLNRLSMLFALGVFSVRLKCIVLFGHKLWHGHLEGARWIEV